MTETAIDTTRLGRPPFSDARYYQAAVLFGYAVSAREIFHFERTHTTTALCVAWAVALDLLLGRFYYRKLQFPLSAVIIGLASSLLVNSTTPLAYLLAVTLAILSKATLVFRGRHLFNPACFGVTVMLQLAPGLVTGMPSLFGGYVVPSLVFFALGLGVALYARQAEVSLSWIGGFVAFAALRSVLLGTSVWVALAPLFGPAFLLFSFHMISDPATTPRTRRYRIAFGLSVAAIDALLRVLRIPYGSFYALFVMCALNPWIREAEERATRPVPAT